MKTPTKIIALAAALLAALLAQVVDQDRADGGGGRLSLSPGPAYVPSCCAPAMPAWLAAHKATIEQVEPVIELETKGC